MLLTRVIYRKETQAGKTFLICDAGVSELIRPTLYEAFHRVWPAQCAGGLPAVLKPEQTAVDGAATETVDVVGPICETGDFLAKGRPLPRVEAGQLLAVFEAGAYGFTVSSDYGRPAARRRGDGGRGRLPARATAKRRMRTWWRRRSLTWIEKRGRRACPPTGGRRCRVTWRLTIRRRCLSHE